MATNEGFKPPLKFVEGERVLCFHGPLIYEAKCLQTRYEEKTNKPEYHIHYSGWNKSWDEWVPESRVLKHNEANLQKQAELHEAYKNNPKNNKKKRKSVSGGPESVEDSDSRSSTPVSVNEKEKSSDKSSDKGSDKEKAEKVVKEKKTVVSTPTVVAVQSSSQEAVSEGPKKKKPRIEPPTETEDPPTVKAEIKIKIPDDLKPWLVDDWELISRQRKLVNLPATMTVDKILDDYYNTKVSSKSMTPNKELAISEVVNGLKEYFNVALGSQLLYKFERMQYAKLLASHPDTPLNQIYGAVHLLRMFVKLGGILAFVDMDDKTTQLLLAHVYDFLKYMSKNSSTLFSLQDYGVSTCDYQRRMM